MAGNRLDRLPWTSFHTKLLVLLAIGEWVETFDLQMVGPLLPVIADFFKTPIPATSFYILSLPFLGAFFGAVLLGRVGDCVGRRNVVFGNFLITQIAFLLTPFASNIETLGLLRAIAGFGTGSQIPLLVTMIVEFFPARVRGKCAARAFAFAWTAAGSSAAISAALIPMHFLIYGWQWVFVFGGMLLFAVIPLRFMIPESPRWLEARGRNEESESILLRIETIATREKGDLPEPRIAPMLVQKESKFKEIFSNEFRKRTIMLWILQFFQAAIAYGFAIMATTVLLSKGFTIVRSLEYTSAIFLAFPLGYLSGSIIVDNIKFDRKWQLACGYTGFGVLSLLFAFSVTPVEVVVTGFASTFWHTAVIGSALTMYPSELYPTRLRATGSGWQYSVSRIGNALWLTLLPLVFAEYGALFMFTVILLMSLCVALDVAILGPKASQVRLEDLSP